VSSPFLLPETYLGHKPAVTDDRPDLYRHFADESEGIEDMTPGAAIVALATMWLAEHWTAMAIGGAVGMLAIAIPAMILAPGF
jgi:hypothetical protein